MRFPKRFAQAIASSQLTLLTGMNGQTSVAPMRGCAPLCLRISINSVAFLIARNAASTAASGLPTNVTTVRFVLAPGSTSNSETPSTDAITSVICRMMFWSRPSEKFGTHSINFCMAQGSTGSSFCNGGTRPSQIFRAWNAHVRNHRAIVAASLRRGAPSSCSRQRGDTAPWLQRCLSRTKCY